MIDTGTLSSIWKIKSVQFSSNSGRSEQINCVTGIVADGSLSFVSNELITASGKVIIGNDLIITAQDLSCAGTSIYGNWSGGITLTPIKTGIANTASGYQNNGLATDMLGNVETTHNGVPGCRKCPGGARFFIG